MSNSHDPVRLHPGDPTPTGSYVDDDWFRFYGPNPGSLEGTTHYEMHELCDPEACAYRPDSKCVFHIRHKDALGVGVMKPTPSLADEHMALVHPDGSECTDGCDAAPMLSYAELREQRDKLLEVLTHLHRWAGIMPKIDADLLSAAIAKIGGGA